MSIRKRTWETAAGEKREAWVADYTDQAGKRHLKTCARKKDAEAFLTTARFQVAEGTHTAESLSITVAQAADAWLDSCSGLEAATLASYRAHVRLHIVPFLGRTKLAQLTAPAVREFEDKLRRGDPALGEQAGRARSPAMVRKVRTSLGSILADAQERGTVARNVARELRSRRKAGKERQADRRRKGKLKVGVDIPTPAEVRAIIGALPTLRGRWRPLMLTAIFAGLRASELRGLRWADVDFKAGEIHVRQRADRYNKIGPPKSEAGERSIPMPPMLATALKEWRLACPRSPLDLAFPTGPGKVETHQNLIRRAVVPAQLAAGVVAPVLDPAGQPIARYTGIHAFRHFYASWCINRRVDGGLELPLKVVQARLGHSSIVMTADVYGHLFVRGDDSAELAAAESSLMG